MIKVIFGVTLVVCYFGNFHMNGIGYYGDITNNLEIVYEDNQKKGKLMDLLDPMTKKKKKRLCHPEQMNSSLGITKYLG
jgi:hypothetical protein